MSDEFKVPDNLQKWIWDVMEEKGFHEGRTDSAHDTHVRLALICTEIGEAINEVKRSWSNKPSKDVVDKYCKEVADVAIRVLDLAECCNLPDVFKVVANHAIPYFDQETFPTRDDMILRTSVMLSESENCSDELDRASKIGYWEEPRYRSEFSFHLGSIISSCSYLCRSAFRNLTEEIVAKMKENLLRPKKYGTPDEVKG